MRVRHSSELCVFITVVYYSQVAPAYALTLMNVPPLRVNTTQRASIKGTHFSVDVSRDIRV